jgi:hypothetical protein
VSVPLPRRRAGFTLIELLVVIAIMIGLLRRLLTGTTMTGTVRVPIACSVLVSATGCGGKPAEAEGAVTYNGQPVTEGVIAFLPAAEGGPSGGGGVINGRYRVYDKVGLPPASAGSRSAGRSRPKRG